MDKKRGLTILIIIAAILAITAIVLNTMDSEVLTTRESNEDSGSGGIVGVDIIPMPVEDKLAESPGIQS